MEGWRDGGMEGWRDGGMEGWRDGGMEGWRDREKTEGGGGRGELHTSDDSLFTIFSVFLSNRTGIVIRPS